MIKYVSDLWQVGCFLRVLQFPSLWYNWNIVESGVKHHNPNLFYYDIMNCVYSSMVTLRTLQAYGITRRVWSRYQRCNQNPYIEEEQTIQWQKDKVQKDKQRSIKHTYKTKARVKRTPLKTTRWPQVLRKGRQFLLHYWHSSC